jgi:hypothetical protein
MALEPTPSSLLWALKIITLELKLLPSNAKMNIKQVHTSSIPDTLTS